MERSEEPRTSPVRWAWAVAAGLATVLVCILALLLLAPPDTLADYIASRPIPCEQMGEETIRKSQPEKLRATHEGGGLHQFAYTVGAHAPGEVTPTVAMRAFDGWLLGSDRGEFGGELVYRPDEGEDLLLANINIEDIYWMPQGFIAVAGRRAIISADSYGAVITIVRRSDGVGMIETTDLPSAPLSSWLLKSGELLINTIDQVVLLSDSNVLRPVECE